MPDTSMLRLWSHNDTPLCYPLPFRAAPNGKGGWYIPPEEPDPPVVVAEAQPDNPNLQQNVDVTSTDSAPTEQPADRDVTPAQQVSNETTECSEEHIPSLTKEQLAIVAQNRSRRRREISKHSNLLEHHNLCTHHPKHPDCPVCNGSKVQREQCRKRSAKAAKSEELSIPKPTKHGQQLTIDHFILEK